MKIKSNTQKVLAWGILIIGLVLVILFMIGQTTTPESRVAKIQGEIVEIGEELEALVQDENLDAEERLEREAEIRAELEAYETELRSLEEEESKKE